MSTWVEIGGARFLDNNFLDDDGVTLTGLADGNGQTASDVLDKVDFGVYQLTETVADDAYIIDVQLTAPLNPSSMVMLAANVNNFYLTSESTVEVEASNFGFGTVQKTFTGRHSRFGVFCDLVEDGVDNSYTYWRIKIAVGNRGVDENLDALDIKYLFLGDGVRLTQRNITRRFSVDLKDLTQVFTSESGRQYYNQKPQRLYYNGLRFQYMSGQDRENFQKFYYFGGISKNFLFCPDPTGFMEAEAMELMRMVSFDALPKESHVQNDEFEVSFNLSEAV